MASLYLPYRSPPAPGGVSVRLPSLLLRLMEGLGFTCVLMPTSALHTEVDSIFYSKFHKKNKLNVHCCVSVVCLVGHTCWTLSAALGLSRPVKGMEWKEWLAMVSAEVSDDKNLGTSYSSAGSLEGNYKTVQSSFSL